MYDSDDSSDTDNDTKNYLYLIKCNYTTLQKMPNAIVTSKNLNVCANDLLNKISEINNHGWTSSEMNYDCVAVGVTENNCLIVGANVKERYPSLTEKDGIDYGEFGLHDYHVEPIERTIQTVFDGYGDFKVEIIKQKLDQNEQSSEFINTRDHAQMQIVSFAKESGSELVAIGTSKPPCAPCKAKLENRGVEFHQEKDSNKDPKNWEDPDQIQTQPSNLYQEVRF